MSEIKTVLTALKYVFFPRRCCFCGKVIVPTETECDKCREEVMRVEFPICFKCGAGKDKRICKKNKNRFITAFAAPFYYCGEVKTGILRLKSNGEKGIAEPFAEMMANFVKIAYDGVKFDYVTYVPMTEKELGERGYNQSELMASHMARELGLPCKGVISKLYETKRQRNLSEKYRSGNVLGVFDVPRREEVVNKRILLCDDVLTTGATLTECAKMLSVSGAREIMCITAAVGLPKKKRG